MGCDEPERGGTDVPEASAPGNLLNTRQKQPQKRWLCTGWGVPGEGRGGGRSLSLLCIRGSAALLQ